MAAAVAFMRQAGVQVAEVATGGDPGRAPARHTYEKPGSPHFRWSGTTRRLELPRQEECSTSASPPSSGQLRVCLLLAVAASGRPGVDQDPYPGGARGVGAGGKESERIADRAESPTRLVSGWRLHSSGGTIRSWLTEQERSKGRKLAWKRPRSWGYRSTTGFFGAGEVGLPHPRNLSAPT